MTNQVHDIIHIRVNQERERNRTKRKRKGKRIEREIVEKEVKENVR